MLTVHALQGAYETGGRAAATAEGQAWLPEKHHQTSVRGYDGCIT